MFYLWYLIFPYAYHKDLILVQLQVCKQWNNDIRNKVNLCWNTNDYINVTYKMLNQLLNSQFFINNTFFPSLQYIYNPSIYNSTSCVTEDYSNLYFPLQIKHLKLHLGYDCNNINIQNLKYLKLKTLTLIFISLQNIPENIITNINLQYLEKLTLYDQSLNNVNFLYILQFFNKNLDKLEKLKELHLCDIERDYNIFKNMICNLVNLHTCTIQHSTILEYINISQLKHLRLYRCLFINEIKNTNSVMNFMMKLNTLHIIECNFCDDIQVSTFIDHFHFAEIRQFVFIGNYIKQDININVFKIISKIVKENIHYTPNINTIELIVDIKIKLYNNSENKIKGYKRLFRIARAKCKKSECYFTHIFNPYKKIYYSKFQSIEPSYKKYLHIYPTTLLWQLIVKLHAIYKVNKWRNH